MTTIRTSGFNAELKKLNMQIEKETDDVIDNITGKIFSEIKDNTPVRTGRLKRGWRRTRAIKGKATISNNVPYVIHVEEGTSRQPGQHFIRRAISKYTSIIGNFL